MVALDQSRRRRDRPLPHRRRSLLGDRRLRDRSRSPFPVLRHVEVLTPFSRRKQRAIRQLHYDASAKVFLQFRRRFWEDDDGIVGGGTVTDLAVRNVYYPDHGRDTGRGVMLASYTWGEDAQRWGSLSPEDRIVQALEDVTRIHPQAAEEFEVGASKMWHDDEFAGGAFALFDPGQQTLLYDAIVRARGPRPLRGRARVARARLDPGRDRVGRPRRGRGARAQAAGVPVTDDVTIRGIATWARTEPDRPAFVCGDRVVTYGELRRAHDAARARASRARASAPTTASRSCCRTASSSSRRGRRRTSCSASVVLVNWHLKADELAYILADSGARLLVGARRPGASTSRPRWPRARAARCSSSATRRRRYEAAIAAASDGRRAARSRRSPRRSSTRRARPVGPRVSSTARPTRTPRRATWRVSSCSWGWTADDVYILSGPAYHAGPGGWTMAALYVGAPTVVLPTFDAPRVAAARRRAPGHVQLHGARALHPHPRGARGRARRARPLVAAADRARGCAVPGAR